MQNLRKIILEELNNISELVRPGDIDLTSFTMHDELNGSIWDGNIVDEKIKHRLLKIANDFIIYLDIPWVNPVDVTLTGSLANYNWSKNSDVDLHILFNFSEVNDNEEMTKDYLNSKRKIWNETHDINIKGFEVELYCQDIKEPHYSTGVYSLKDNKWVNKPNPNEPKLDKTLIKNKASQIMSTIDEIIEEFETSDYESVMVSYDLLWDKIKKMRQSGLESGGEFSYENLIFKVLRRTGYLEDLIKIKNDSYDKTNSIR